MPKKDVPEKRILEQDVPKHLHPDFRTTILERRLISKRISMMEFKKQHYLGDQALLRPDTEDLFELGQYVILIHMKGYPQFDGAGALVIDYEEAATGLGSYTIALLGRHAGGDLVGCPSSILKACTDEKTWNKMFKEDSKLARDCVFIEFGSELNDHLR